MFDESVVGFDPVGSFDISFDNDVVSLVIGFDDIVVLIDGMKNGMNVDSSVFLSLKACKSNDGLYANLFVASMSYSLHVFFYPDRR